MGFAHHASASKFNMTDPVLEGQEEGGGAAAKDPNEIVLDDAAASAVLERLVHLGFLDEHVSGGGGGGGGIDAASSPPSPGRWLLEEPAEYTPQSSREAMERLAEARAGRIGGPGEEGRPRCEVIIRDGGSGGCITRAALAEEMARRVRAHPFEGRANIADLAVAAGVREEDAEEVVKLLHAGDADGFSGRPAFVQAGREVLTAEHLDALARKVASLLEEGEGRAAVSDLAVDLYHLPFEACLASLVGRMEGGAILPQGARLADLRFGERSGGGGGTRREIVIAKYDQGRAGELQARLESAIEPTPLAGLVDDLGWDDKTALERVRLMCTDGTLRGALRGGDGAVYTPHMYGEAQRKGVDDFFSANGYATSELFLSLGLPTHSMGKYINESFEDAVALSDSVIDPKVIMAPLEALVEDAITQRGFVDLRTSLPDAVISSEADMHQILGGDGFKDGISVVCDGEALFFSTGMVHDIDAKILPAIIEGYGTTRAQEIDDTTGISKKKQNLSEDDEEVIITGAKLKKRGKRAGKSSKTLHPDGDGMKKKASAREKRLAKKGDASASDESFGVVPLTVVAIRLAEEYPDLRDVQESVSPMLDEASAENRTWEVDDGETGGPLFEFCRAAIYSPKFIVKCGGAVRAELERIESRRQGGAVGGRSTDAPAARSIEGAFEDVGCFPAACHLVQMLAKLPRLAAASDEIEEVIVERLEKDFLKGCAAWFTARVTQFCLFKHEVEEGIFAIEDGDGTFSLVGTGLPEYCQAVDTTMRSFGSSYLTCSPADDGELRDPLPLLRELLPGSVGVELARMWVFCGSDTYQGGRRQGDFDAFLNHVEESCLVVCGLPFKALDKKAEKAAMFGRRRELTAQLEAATDSRAVLELSTMLLFQQVRAIAVAGERLRGSVLDLLCQERKIPEAVAEKMKELASAILEEEKYIIDESLVAIVKDIGGCRDVSKYVI